MKLEEYIDGVIKREEWACKHIYDLLSQQMFATSFRITNNKEDSKDVLQDSFLKSFRDIEKLSDKRKYAGWLKRIVINNSLQKIRKKNDRFTELTDELDVETTEDDDWLEDNTISRIKSELHLLPDKCRVVFSLYVFEDLRHREISEELGISVSTSKSQYQYARKLLKMKLSKILYNEG